MQFKNSTHLVCFIHVKDCIIRKLRDIGIDKNGSNAFVEEIFGIQQGSHLYTGLVDCESEIEFDEKLRKLKNIWNDRESKLLCSFAEPVFFDWFLKYQSEICKKKMLKPVRVFAKLGNPPITYTNNANESANARLKEKVNNKKSELKVFCSKMRELVDTQYRNVEKAFTLNTGPYAASQCYMVYQENPINWIKKKDACKQRIIRKFHNIPLAINSSPVPSISIDQERDHTPLSVSLEDADLPSEVFREMWKKKLKSLWLTMMPLQLLLNCQIAKWLPATQIH